MELNRFIEMQLDRCRRDVSTAIWLMRGFNTKERFDAGSHPLAMAAQCMMGSVVRLLALLVFLKSVLR